MGLDKDRVPPGIQDAQQALHPMSRGSEGHEGGLTGGLDWFGGNDGFWPGADDDFGGGQGGGAGNGVGIRTPGSMGLGDSEEGGKFNADSKSNIQIHLVSES